MINGIEFVDGYLEDGFVRKCVKRIDNCRLWDTSGLKCFECERLGNIKKIIKKN